MELTQEYFDKGIANILEKMSDLKSNMATKDDIAAIWKEMGGMVTKDDLKIQLTAQTLELKQYVTESFETQQDWMDERFKELIVNYDVRDRVGRLEKDVLELKLQSSSQCK